jgi:hypothetical protein
MRKTNSIVALAVLLVVVLFQVAAPVLGQEKVKETGPGWITQSFKVQHVSLGKLRTLFRDLPGSTRTDSELGLLIVHAPPQTMSFVQETVAKLDVPSLEAPRKPTVEFTGYLLGAGQGPATAEDVAMIPPILRPVISELQEKFPYKRYRVLDSTLIRVRAHERGQVEGLIPNFLPEPLTGHTARYNLRFVLGGAPLSGAKSYVELLQVALEGQVPIVMSPKGTAPQDVNINTVRFNIQTNMVIQDGETVVVGKSGVQGVVDGIFLVLRAEVVD